MQLSRVSMHKGKSKKGKRTLRSTRIEKADNGFSVHKDFEPTGDPEVDYGQQEKPSVFSGKNALQQAHDYSAQCHSEGMDDNDADDSQGGGDAAA